MRLPFLFGFASLLLAGCGGTVIDTGTGGNGTTTGTDPGPGPFDTCTAHADCVLANTSCCGPCGVPKLADVTAVNSAAKDAYFAQMCPGTYACPMCDAAVNPNLFATCDAGHCKALDLTQIPASACGDNLDCVLRAGTSCCGACSADASNLVAVSVNGNFESLVCDPGTPCPDCYPQMPPGAQAVCSSGQCAVFSP